MPESAPVMAPALVEALRAGGEALDRGLRGPAPELALLREAGLQQAPLPIAQGGHGWGTTPAGAMPMAGLLMTLGGASLPIARLYEGHVNALQLVLAFGTARQQDRVAQAVQAGILLGVWGADSPEPVVLAPTEPPVLRGTKAFASGLGEVGLALVTARAAAGLYLVLADASDPARAHAEAWDVDAMVGSRSGHFRCDGLPAGDAERLGAADALFTEPAFHGGAWRMAACYAGALARLARLAAEGLATHPSTPAGLMSARLGALAIEAEGAALWVRQAAAAVEQPTPPESAASRAAVRTALFAREATEQAANRMLPVIERIAGTAMHRRTSELGRLARDLRFYLRQADLDGKLALAVQFWLEGD